MIVNESTQQAADNLVKAAEYAMSEIKRMKLTPYYSAYLQLRFAVDAWKVNQGEAREAQMPSSNHRPI